jgi:Fe-S oxidoreductase
MNTIDKCSQCGFCKATCPIYRVLLNETDSPRGKAILLKKNLEGEFLYSCSICGACEATCPAQVDLDIRKKRANLVSKGKETEANKIMMKNIREHGNPFGKPGAKVKDLYCC